MQTHYKIAEAFTWYESTISVVRRCEILKLDLVLRCVTEEPTCIFFNHQHKSRNFLGQAESQCHNTRTPGLETHMTHSSTRTCKIAVIWEQLSATHHACGTVTRNATRKVSTAWVMQKNKSTMTPTYGKHCKTQYTRGTSCGVCVCVSANNGRNKKHVSKREGANENKLSHACSPPTRGIDFWGFLLNCSVAAALECEQMSLK